MFLAFFDHVLKFPTLVCNSKHLGYHPYVITKKKTQYAFSGMTKIDFHHYCPIDKIQEDASYRKIEELHGTTKDYP